MSALASGMTPIDRSVASTTKPSTNHGTNVGARRDRSCRAAPGVRAARRMHDRAEHQNARQLHDRRNLAAQRAHRERGREHLRHCVHGEPGEHAVLIVRERRAARSAAAARAPRTTPSTAVSAIDAATSSRSAPMTGATAAIAELPQIALPQATSTARFGDSPAARPIAYPTPSAADDEHDDADAPAPAPTRTAAAHPSSRRADRRRTSSTSLATNRTPASRACRISPRTVRTTMPIENRQDERLDDRRGRTPAPRSLRHRARCADDRRRGDEPGTRSVDSADGADVGERCWS